MEPRFRRLGVGSALGLPRSGGRDVAVERPQLAHRDVYAQRKRHGGLQLVAVDRPWRGPALAASGFGYSGRMCRVFRGATRRGRVAAAAARRRRGACLHRGFRRSALRAATASGWFVSYSVSGRPQSSSRAGRRPSPPPLLSPRLINPTRFVRRRRRRRILPRQVPFARSLLSQSRSARSPGPSSSWYPVARRLARQNQRFRSWGAPTSAAATHIHRQSYPA